MKARRVMTRKVHCVLPETPLSEAWALLHRYEVRHLPVVQHGALVGIVSDRDLLEHLVRSKRGEAFFEDATVGAVMTLNPVVAPLGASVADMARLMVKRHIDSVPIVDMNGTLAGLVTSTDLMQLLLEGEVDALPWSFRVAASDVRA